MHLLQDQGGGVSGFYYGDIAHPEGAEGYADAACGHAAYRNEHESKHLAGPVPSPGDFYTRLGWLPL